MKRHHSGVAALLIGLLVPSSSQVMANSEIDGILPYDQYVPANVSLGMTAAAFKAERPNAIAIGTAGEDPDPNATDFEMVEKQPASRPLWKLLQFTFVGSKLGGFTWTYHGTHHTSVESVIKNTMLSGWTKESEQRRDVPLVDEWVPRTIELWKPAAGSQRAYILACPEAVILVVFDPAYASMSDFFPSQEDLE